MTTKTCVVVFNNSWGEVDFVLPIIKNLYDKKYEIFISFKTNEFYQKKKNYLDLYNILNKISFILETNYGKRKKYNIYKDIFSYLTSPRYLFTKIKKFSFLKLKKHIQTIQNNNTENHINFLLSKNKNINLILCADFDSNYNLWVKKFPKAKFCLFPHAITLRGNNLNKFRNVDEKVFKESFSDRKYQLSKFPNKTILFSCNKDEMDYFSQFAPKNINIKILGIPRLTNKWLSYLHSNLAYCPKKNKNLLLVIGKISYLGENEINKKIISVVRLAEQFGIDIIIKNHPRNNLNIKRFKNFTKKTKIIESLYSISGILKYCDMVILTSKTGVSLECAFQDKVVVEYYKYGRSNLKNKVYEYKINNQLQSIYRLNKLTYPCESHLSLLKFFKKINLDKNFKKNLLKNQRIGLMKNIPKKEIKLNFENFIN